MNRLEALRQHYDALLEPPKDADRALLDRIDNGEPEAKCQMAHESSSSTSSGNRQSPI
jgi:hypothetical protein